MNRWNLILLALSAVVVIDVFYVLKKDLSSGHGFQDDMGPTESSQAPATKKKDAVKALKQKITDNEAPKKKNTSMKEDKKEKIKMENTSTKEDKEEKMKTEKKRKEADETKSKRKPDDVHKIAGLNCDAYGGPSEDVAAEMVYWQDIPSDANFVSPFKHTGPEPKYLTFEPDEGGWNNIRMSMETAVTISHAMGRILVMPPEQGMYLLGKGVGGQKNRFSFTDFFHFDSMAKEHTGVEIISFEEFLNREVMGGQMKNKVGQVTFPPHNRTDWNGADREAAKELDRWTRTFTTNPKWFFDECMAAFPSGTGEGGPVRMREWLEEVKKTDFETRRTEYNGKPVPVDAPPLDRLRENFAHRKDLCIYDKALQEAKVFHLMGDNQSGARLLVHFYAFLFFEDWKQDLWTKRFVRDHLRYVDEIQCAAARVVAAVREKSRENGHGGKFNSMHIRRGDFQYKDTRVEADVIYENIKDIFKEGQTVYIATDERDMSFFKVLKQHYKVYFLDDFQPQLKKINTNYFGMLDQRIASRGEIFIGCFYSTFTGYINRMRGYHHQLEKGVGWENGEIPSFYYIPKDRKFAVRQYRSISPPMWSREFPVGWRDLDRGIEEIAAANK